MAITGNKGEWSEIYTLFKLLGDGIVHAGDAEMNKLDLYYPILNIIREESKRYEYKPNTSQKIVVIDENGKEFAKISMDKFNTESMSLLCNIKNGSDRSFSISSTESFMNQIGCSKLKADSHDKSDIHIVIHDLRTNMTPMLGFSIKSQLGSPSSLLNAGIPTNFLYKVSGCDISDSDIIAINSINSHHLRMQELLHRGASIEYVDVENRTFKNNLLFMDCCMPQFIGLCLLQDSLSKSSLTVKQAVENVTKLNPLGFEGDDVLSFYEHKMKVLLLDAALGMTPAKEWKGLYDANGGYLVVRKDGEIVCYHFYNRNDVEDYLFNNTRFEKASRSRYNYGSIFRSQSGDIYLRLNLQIRFKK